MMQPNLRAMVAQGGKWAVSRRNFSSSPTSVESNGGKRDFGKLIAASRVLIGVTSVGVGFGLVAVVMGNAFFVSLEEAYRRKVNTKGEFFIPAKEFMENPGNYLVEVKDKMRPKERAYFITGEELMANRGKYLVRAQEESF